MAIKVTVTLEITLSDEDAAAYATEYAKNADLVNNPQAFAQDVSETIGEIFHVTVGGRYLITSTTHPRVTGKRVK